MRRTALCLLPLVSLLLGGAGPAFRPPSASTPHTTLAALKRAVAYRDRAAEWATLSPGFKLRLNRRAGRNVDVGDYVQMRTTHAGNARIREMERYLPSARIIGAQYDHKGRALVTIRFSANLFFGADIKVRMINHALWELHVRGESEPFWGFVGHKSPVAVKGKDGSYTVQTKNRAGKVTWEQKIPKEKVLSFRQTNRWYFSGFGALEEEFFDL